ncbi:MAG: universal stress protein E [Paraglaciecola sp.]
MNIKNILVISDQKDKSQKALAHAKNLAKRYDASLHVVGFSYENLAILTESLSETQIEQAKERILQDHKVCLEGAIAQQKLPNNTTCEIVWSKDIARWVKQHCADRFDLIIKTGHRSERAFYVPTDWHLLRNGVSPIMLVAEKKWRKKQSIMVSLDMASKVKSKQALNQKLIEAGKMLATANDMPLHLCFSLAISPVLKDLGIIDKNKTVKQAKAKYMPLMQAMLGDYELPPEHIHIKAGDTKKVIPSVASEIGAALVVIGSVGRKGLKAKLLGNTAESVLVLLKTDVLIVQP